MKMIVRSHVMLITDHRPVSSLTLEPGTYDCRRGSPPDGCDQNGDDWIYYRSQCGVTFGANARYLKGVEFIE